MGILFSAGNKISLADFEFSNLSRRFGIFKSLSQILKMKSLSQEMKSLSQILKMKSLSQEMKSLSQILKMKSLSQILKMKSLSREMKSLSQILNFQISLNMIFLNLAESAQAF